MAENTTDNLNLIYCAPEYLHPYVRACLEISKAAHEDQTRKKAGGINLPYITHPIATLNILLKSGEQDPIILSAALLHDVIEDCKNYLQTNDSQPSNLSETEVLKRLLWDAFEHGMGSENASQWMTDVSKIVNIVDELSAENGLGNRKRIVRTLGAMNYSDHAAKIKLAELTASLADDIIHSSSRTREEQLKYNNYVWTVAKAAGHTADAKPKSEQDSSAKSIFKLMRHLHDLHRELLDYPEIKYFNTSEKDALRDNFTLEEAWLKAQQLPDWDKGIQASIYAEHPNIRDKKTGITQIGFTEKGSVTRVRIVFDPNAQDEDEHFAIINQLTRLIEDQDPDNAIGYGKDYYSEENGGPHQLKLKLRKPMSLEEFLYYAENAGAINKEGVDRDFINVTEKLIEHWHNTPERNR